MLFRNLGADDQQPTARWEDLGHGAPTILGFANLCSQAMKLPAATDLADQGAVLCDEAKTILVAAAKRGTIEIRASREGIDSAERFLAICIECDDRKLLFLQKENPEQTIRFLEGFRQLCQMGFVIHHLQKDFSLSAAGFDLAKTLGREHFERLLGFAVDVDH